MKLRFLVLALLGLFVQRSFANEVGNSSGLTIEQIIKESRNSPFNMSVQHYARPAKRNAPQCSRFIQSDGGIGPYGIELLKEIIDPDKPEYQDCFYNKIDFTRLCPAYRNLNPYRKRQFWVFMFGAIAIEESTCNPNATNGRATNGRADGLFMLEYSNRLRRRSGRPAECKPGISANTQSLDFQVECAVAIFKRRYCDWGGTPGVTSSYWQPLNGLNRHSSRIVRQFPYCQN